MSPEAHHHHCYHHHSVITTTILATPYRHPSRPCYQKFTITTSITIHLIAPVISSPSLNHHYHHFSHVPHPDSPPYRPKLTPIVTIPSPPSPPSHLHPISISSLYLILTHPSSPSILTSPVAPPPPPKALPHHHHSISFSLPPTVPPLVSYSTPLAVFSRVGFYTP